MININELMQIASENKQGFTISRHGLKIKKGFAVATEKTQNSFNIQGAQNVLDFCKDKPSFCIGGWLDAKTGQYFFDAVLIFSDIRHALSYTSSQKQTSFYDLGNKNEYRLSNF